MGVPHFPVDPDRVSLMGGSMGGAATWYLASHYPDRFAAAAPFCGYADYQLWEKPGGHIMRTQDWERFSWESRGAAYRVENLTNMALWITHGEWDISIGGGVPVEHSRQISAHLTKLGVEHRFTEVPSCGHGCLTDETGPPVAQWLCRQRRQSCPRRSAWWSTRFGTTVHSGFRLTSWRRTGSPAGSKPVGKVARSRC